LKATAAKIPVVGLTVTADQSAPEGKVRATQLNPSVDEAAAVEPALPATAAKIPVVGLTVTAFQ